MADADERFERGLEDAPQLFGFDIDSQAVGIARGNARRLGLSKLVTFGCADCADLPVSLHQNGIEFDQPGFIAINPPYGMRLLAHGLDGFYEHLSRGLRELSDSWSMTVITPDDDFDGSVGFEAQRTLSVYNGAIEATLRSYRLGHSSIIEVPLVTLEGAEVKVAVTSDHALQFAARLRKMAKARRKWARKNKVHAYRIYDADLPDYAVAVDVFEEQGSGDTNLLITEYQAPKEIDPAKATRRFKDAAPLLLCFWAFLRSVCSRVFVVSKRRIAIPPRRAYLPSRHRRGSGASLRARSFRLFGHGSVPRPSYYSQYGGRNGG